MSDHEAKELAFAYPESTFFKVEAHVIFAEFPKDFFQVCHVLGYALRLDDHVVHIYLDVYPIYYLKTRSIIRWYVGPAFFRLNGMTL